MWHFAMVLFDTIIALFFISLDGWRSSSVNGNFQIICLTSENHISSCFPGLVVASIRGQMVRWSPQVDGASQPCQTCRRYCPCTERSWVRWIRCCHPLHPTPSSRSRSGSPLRTQVGYWVRTPQTSNGHKLKKISQISKCCECGILFLFLSYFFLLLSYFFPYFFT